MVGQKGDRGKKGEEANFLFYQKYSLKDEMCVHHMTHTISKLTELSQ